jgi:hypothetical protein
MVEIFCFVFRMINNKICKRKSSSESANDSELQYVKERNTLSILSINTIIYWSKLAPLAQKRK